MNSVIALVFLFSSYTIAVKKPIASIYTANYIIDNDLTSFDSCNLEPVECNADYKYRSFDGSCNNLEHPKWGMAKSALLRVFPARYSDGIELPPVAIDGSELPNARKIVTSVFSDENNPDDVSLIVAQWAQFIAHDFGANINKAGVSDCCASDDRIVCLPIEIPEDDVFFSQFNKTCLSLTRTETTTVGDCDPNSPKVPINGVTHSLDGSQIYGSDIDTANNLREHSNGRMIVRVVNNRCYLPSAGSCYHSDVCYVAGESRVNQNTQLSLLHTMLVREHNRIADSLAQIQPLWDDETIYQEARSIVIAEYLHITYNGFLPNIIDYRFKGLYNYNPSVPNSVLVSFSNPAFRIFHSALQGAIGLYDYHRDPTRYINLTDYMNSPGILEEDNNFDELLLGVITQPMQQIDPFYTAQIEEKLFHFDKSYGTDLNSLDIQRARDHGVASYPTILLACTGILVDDFDDLEPIWPKDKIELVRQIYKSVHDMDLFIGANFENKEKGHRIPPTLECLFEEQFYRWKYGDRFWYEIENETYSFSTEQLIEIKKASLSRLVCDTSDNIVNITINAWEPPSEQNGIVPCTEIPSIDLSKWL